MAFFYTHTFIVRVFFGGLFMYKICLHTKYTKKRIYFTYKQNNNKM